MYFIRRLTNLILETRWIHLNALKIDSNECVRNLFVFHEKVVYKLLTTLCRLTNNILSTAQQVWLQKLGGANNPVKEYIEKVSSDETSDIEKSRLNIPKAIPKPEPEKPNSSQRTTSDGSRRGERWSESKIFWKWPSPYV